MLFSILAIELALLFTYIVSRSRQRHQAHSLCHISYMHPSDTYIRGRDPLQHDRLRRLDLSNLCLRCRDPLQHLRLRRLDLLPDLLQHLRLRRLDLLPDLLQHLDELGTVIHCRQVTT